MERRRYVHHPKIIRDGFIYSYHRVVGDHYHYRCDHTNQGCRARMSVSGNYRHQRFLNEDHIGHEPNEGRCEMKILMDDMQFRADEVSM